MIGREPKSLQKIAMLKHFRRSKKLKNIFKYAVDPTIKYYIRKFPDDVVGTGSGVIRDETWEILDKLNNREVTGKAAKDLLFTHMTTMTSGECGLLRRIVEKKLRVGVAAAMVNEAWPGLIPVREIQKAEDYLSYRAAWPCYGSLKLDGIRSDYNSGLFLSRGGYAITGLGHIHDSIISSAGGGYWDGELWVPAMWPDFDAMSGYLRSKSSHKPLARYVVFDNLSMKDEKQSIRLATLSSNFDKFLFNKKDSSAPATYLPHVLYKTPEAVQAAFAKVVNARHEGLMIKDPNAQYRAGRSYNWMKLKKGGDGEFEIVGVYEGEGHLTGTLGGIEIQTTPTHVTRVGSGFSDKRRAEIWNDPSKVLGRLATISYMEKTKDGRLRHPVFKTIRWDIWTK